MPPSVLDGPHNELAVGLITNWIDLIMEAVDLITNWIDLVMKAVGLIMN